MSLKTQKYLGKTKIMNLVPIQDRNQSLGQETTQPIGAPPSLSRATTASTHPKIRRIVLLTDFSPLARQAYSSAVGLAKKHDATLLLVHVDRLRAPEYSGITDAQYWKALRDNMVAESRRCEFDGCSIELILKSYRDVDRQIESFGSILGGDLVVASTPATAGWQRLHENDRAESVVSKASIPALLHGPQFATMNPDHVSRVLVYGDSVDSVASTVSWVQSLVCHDDCAIKLLMPRSSMRRNWFSRSRTQQFEQDRSFQVALFNLVKIQLADFNVEIEFTESSPTEEIRRHSQDLDCDLIVLGTNRRYSTAHRTIVRESNCPVLIVRSD